VSSRGEVLFQHTEDGAGDRADLTKVWAIAERAAVGLPTSTATAGMPTPPVAVPVAGGTTATATVVVAPAAGGGAGGDVALKYHD